MIGCRARRSRLTWGICFLSIFLSSLAGVHAQDDAEYGDIPVPEGAAPELSDSIAEMSQAPGGAYGGTPVPAAAPKPAAGAPAAPAKKKGPPQPWKNSFYDNDFSYKKDPAHDYIPGEELKDIPVEDWFGLDEPTRFSYGTELRFRLMDEANRIRPVPPGVKNIAVYNLWRYRQYVDLKYSDDFRVYAEMIDASMGNNPLTTTGIDINRWDLQNLLVDIKIAERDDKPVYFRVGRQELLYGSQRLISPLDWANTRRNFEGLKVFSKGDDWDFDAWCTRPVNTATPGDGPLSHFMTHPDYENMSHTFSGAWWTYKAVKDQTWDVYWIWDWNKKVVFPNMPGGNRHTFATRWLRSFPVTDFGEVDRTWLAEVEGGYQVGDDFGRRVNAGFVTTGLGHQWTGTRWMPTLWAYYDWASGSRTYGSGPDNTFAQQYGLTHAFLGQIDNLARQNIADINAKFSITPTKKLVMEAQFHWFDLQTSSDVLYNITGQPFGKPNTGKHVGEEVDLVATYTYNPNFSIQLGYFYMWYGDFVQNNLPRGNAYQFYVMPTLRF